MTKPDKTTDDATARDKAEAPTGSCPICKRAPEAAYRPFCSKRCANVDLSRWLSGNYVIPGDEPADTWDEDTPTPPQYEH